MLIRECKNTDTKEVLDIYNHYVKNTCVTFEESEFSLKKMESQIKEVTKEFVWLVAQNNDGKLTGYAYASSFAKRSAYKHTAEITIYLDPNQTGLGIGKTLYKELIKKLKQMDIHRVIALIALPNESSIKLHESFGFEKVGHLNEVGYKFNQWIDVGHWQLKLK